MVKFYDFLTYGLFIFICIIFVGHRFFPEYMPWWLYTPGNLPLLDQAAILYLILFPLFLRNRTLKRQLTFFHNPNEKKSFTWVPFVLVNFKWFISIVFLCVLVLALRPFTSFYQILILVFCTTVFQQIVDGLMQIFIIQWMAYPAARAEYDKSLQRVELLTKYRLKRGSFLTKECVLIDAGRLSEARPSCEKALATITEPYKRHLILYNLARIEIGSGHLEKAQQLLEEAAVRGGALASPLVYTNLALVMLERNVTPELALQHVETAIKRRKFYKKLSIQAFIILFIVDSELGKRHLLRAWASSLMGNQDQANRFIQLALPLMKPAMKSDYAYEYYLLGRTLIAQGKTQEGKEYIQKSIEIDPVGFSSILAKRFLSQA